MLCFFESLERNISENVAKSKIITRPNASNGLWVCCLLPATLLICSFKYPMPPTYQLTAAVSSGLCLHAVIFILLASVSSNIFKSTYHGGWFTSALLSAFILFSFCGRGISFSLTISCLAVGAYGYGIRYLLMKMPKTFTIGEALLVMQMIVLFGTASFINIYQSLENQPKTDFEIVALIIQVGLLTVCVIIGLMAFTGVANNSPSDVVKFVGINGVIMLCAIHYILGQSSIIWIFSYIIYSLLGLKLMLAWSVSVLISVAAVYYQTSALDGKASTADRKVFHIIASLVFIPGIILDLPLMCLASGVAFAFLILIEACRIFLQPEYSDKLQYAFNIYSDEKDIGGVSLTPIYLFIGISCPLILMPLKSDFTFHLLSGVLSIGIGDAVASCIGSKFGQYKWAGTQRTFEGTATNILSQVALVYFLKITGAFAQEYVLSKTVISATVVAAVEAKTDQVDNLVLPLVMLLATVVC